MSKAQRFFPVSDRMTLAEAKSLGFESVPTCIPSIGHTNKEVRGILTGEKRSPKKGEWYLSGAEPTVWRASNDFGPNMVFHICKLVRVREKIVTEIVAVAERPAEVQCSWRWRWR